MPLDATPWLFLAGGLAFAVAGIAVLRTTGRAPLLVLALLGALACLVPLALGAVSKSADAEDVEAFASRGLTERAATAANAASSSLDALVRESRAEPAARRRLNRGYPAAATFVDEWDTIGPRLSWLSGAVARSVSDFADVKKIPITFPVWVLMGAGLLTFLAAGAALLRA